MTADVVALDATGRSSASPWRSGRPEGSVDATLTPCPTCDRVRVRPVPRSRPAVTSPELAAEVLLPHLGASDRERCVVAALDTKHRLLEVVTVSIGSLDRTFMAPREVFRDALLANAGAVVVAHNHPSGDVAPSGEDERVTRRLVRAGEVVGIEVLDHLVVGGDRWVSLARRGVV